MKMPDMKAPTKEQLQEDAANRREREVLLERNWKIF